MNQKRIRKLNKKEIKKGNIIYWMSRDQRVKDNWALAHAQELANKNKSNLIVVFCLVPEFLQATIRQYSFMLKGLMQVKQEFDKRKIPFYILTGEPEKQITPFIKKNKIGALVTDFDPLKIKKKWKNQVNKKIKIHFCEVDTHNIVPCWFASPKQEFGAYTLRPKIKKLLPEFLEEFPNLKNGKSKSPKINWNQLFKKLKINKKVPEIDWLKPGEKQAINILEDFIKNKLSKFQNRNDPNKDVLSNLSPYLHFGQISAQRVALKVKKSKAKNKQAFLEELIIRKELADNFCFYNKDYDSVKGFPDWAKKTLNKHRKDKKEYVYNLKQFENAKTHDNLWNAAQLQMVNKGKMHGYMRMYWCKKILEWTKTPEQAMKIAIYLNNKYELDGRDPNGYVGIAWSIGGVHDRAWGERKVFGKIRYMSYNGYKSKFDVKKYISTYSNRTEKS